MTLFRSLLTLVLIFLLTPATLFAQQPSSDWNDVVKLKNGTKIIVITKNGREFAGEKQVASDDTLFMETKFEIQGSRTINLARSEIAEVRKRKSRWILPLIGAAIGVGVGVAIGATQDHPGTDDPHAGKIVIGTLGGLIGAGAGGFAARYKGTKVVYVSP